MQLGNDDVIGGEALAEKFAREFGKDQMTVDSYKRIGTQLKTARCKLGLKLVDVARELRISGDYLKHLENGDFDHLPAPTYVSGFLRSYGKFIGLDGAELASRFYSLQDSSSTQMEYKLPVTAGPPQRSAPAVASLCVVLAVVAYGGWYWVSGPKEPNSALKSELANNELETSRPGMMEKNAKSDVFESQGGAPATDDPAESPEMLVVAPADTVSAEIVQTVLPSVKVESEIVSAASTNIETVNIDSRLPATQVVSNDAEIPQATSQLDTGDMTSQPQIPKLASRSAAEDEMSDRGVVADDTLLRGGVAAVATIRAPDQEMTIRAIASSWVEIVRGDGTPILKKLMKAGETYIFDDSSGLYLSTGNAGGIEIIAGADEVITIGAVGEIVRDLPLVKNRLRDRF